MDLSLSPLVFPLSAKELSRWTRFALRGGIGKGTCLFDREVAEEGDLMFFKEEEIIYLLALNEDQYLGYCEGVCGKFNKNDVLLTTKLKKPVLCPRNHELPSPPPPYKHDTTTKATSDNHSLHHATSNQDFRGKNGGELSSQQVYYDAREDLGKRFGTLQWYGAQNVLQGMTEFREGRKDTDCSDSFKEALDEPVSFDLISEASSSPTFSNKSLTSPSLLASTSSDLDHDLPITPPSEWFSKELPPIDHNLEIETSFAKALSYYNSITPEPLEKIDNDSNTLEFISPLNSGSNYSQSSSNPELYNSHFSDVSLSEILRSKNSNSSILEPTILRSNFSSPSTFRSPSSLQSSNSKVLTSSRWSKVTGEELVSTGDNTESIILDLYGSSRDSVGSIISKGVSESNSTSKLSSFKPLEEVEEVVSSNQSSPSSRSSEKSVLDRLRRGSMPTSPSLDSMVGLPQSESSGSLFSNPSTTSDSSSNWHNSGLDDSIISSATLFHQPYFSPILLGREPSTPSTSTPLTTYTSSIPNSSPLQKARLSRLASRQSLSTSLASPISSKRISPPTFSPQSGDGLESSAPISSNSKLSLRTTSLNIPLPPRQNFNHPLRSSPISNSNSPTPRESFTNSDPIQSPGISWNLPSSNSNYSLAASSIVTSSRKMNNNNSTLRFRTGLTEANFGPPRSFSFSTNLDSNGSNGWETPSLTSSESRDFSIESPASPRSPFSPSSPLARNNSIAKRTIFGSTNRKSSIVPRSKVDYGFPVSSKDFQEETIQLGNVEFEIIKPLVVTSVVESTTQSRSNSLSTGSSTGHSSHTTLEPTSPTLQRRASNRYVVAEEISIENYRAKELKWVQAITSSSSASVKSSKKMNSLVQIGIPSSVRARVYSFLSNSDENKVDGLFSMLCDLDYPKRFERYNRDLDQTFVDHPQFGPNSQSRKDMKLVLKALCIYDSSAIGFEWGISSIIAYFLTLAPPEEAFYLVVALIKNGTMKQSVAENKVQCLAFTLLLESLDPQLAKRFAYLSVDPLHYFSSHWSSSLFISLLPFSTASQVIDLIFFDSNYIFKVGLAILQINRSRLLDTYLCQDRLAIVKYLTNIPETASITSVLLPAIFSLKNDSKIKKALKKAESIMLTMGCDRKVKN